MARRRQYSNTKGKRAALRHIEEAREFTEEIGGSDLDVKKYFFSLSDIELAPILSEYGEDFGSKAEDYARETLPKWKSGNREMSGIVCKRLFGLLPPRMPLKKKYELAENIWKHFGPSSDNSYQIGPNTPISSVEKLIFSKLVEVVTEYSIPENVHNRFSWLSDGDVKAKEDLLNYFRQLEKTLLSEKINLELPILQKQAREQSEVTGRIRSVLQIHKHEISIWIVNSLDDQIVQGAPNYSRDHSDYGWWNGWSFPIFGGVFLVLMYFYLR